MEMCSVSRSQSCVVNMDQDVTQLQQCFMPGDIHKYIILMY